MSAEIKSEVRTFLDASLSGGASAIQDDTKLISSRLLDSILALRLVTHLEAKFNIEFAAHEVTADNLESINRISEFVSSKMK